MRNSRFSDQRIALCLQQAEQGVPVANLSRKPGNTKQTFYRWKWKCGDEKTSARLAHQGGRLNAAWTNIGTGTTNWGGSMLYVLIWAR
jgi:hypothetical protein